MSKAGLVSRLLTCFWVSLSGGYPVKKLNLLCSAATLLAALAFLPSIASAQSSIVGTAKDSTGAVMVGVTVEAASDALIEKQRTVTTDGQGRYAVVDVRPGTYTITFSACRDSLRSSNPLEVPANTTVTIDGALKPGAVGETVNVEAAVATVDNTGRRSPERPDPRRRWTWCPPHATCSRSAH